MRRRLYCLGLALHSLSGPRSQSWLGRAGVRIPGVGTREHREAVGGGGELGRERRRRQIGIQVALVGAWLRGTARLGRRKKSVSLGQHI